MRARIAIGSLLASLALAGVVALPASGDYASVTASARDHGTLTQGTNGAVAVRDRAHRAQEPTYQTQRRAYPKTKKRKRRQH
jgi:hypothetical protein